MDSTEYGELAKPIDLFFTKIASTSFCANAHVRTWVEGAVMHAPRPYLSPPLPAPPPPLQFRPPEGENRAAGAPLIVIFDLRRRLCIIRQDGEKKNYILQEKTEGKGKRNTGGEKGDIRQMRYDTPLEKIH
jgi:hypothetical protein